MLTSLTIKNYALIDELKVDFNSGLTIITGETGAGKSILLGALALVLGKRADLSSIKNTTEKCIVEAVFNIAGYQLKPIFETHDLDYEPQTIIRREILPSGKSRAFVNDTPTTLDSLQVVSNYLVDIHSQHQTLQVTRDSFQFQVIDALANVSTEKSGYSQKLKQYKQNAQLLKELNQQQATAAKELDYNQFLLSELEATELVEGQIETLEEEYKSLNNTEEIGERLLESQQLLGEEQRGILSLLAQVKNNLQKLTSYSKNFTALWERTESTHIELRDIFSEIEQSQEQLESNPARLEEVNQKLQQLHSLLKKHSASTIEELIQIKEKLKTAVFNTQNLEETIAVKTEEQKVLKKELDHLAQEIHIKRKQAIPHLIVQLEEILATLGIPNAQFKIEIAKTENYYSNGSDNLSFLFTANKGTALTDLKKSASGGELSRIMLAIKSILANYIKLPTVIFDEIDTGISGEISNKMAAIMKDMSKSLQILTITHLPQIAAKGDWHFKVFKEDKNNNTHTNMVKLNQDSRIVEIAQMLSGKQATQSAIEHAKQLLN
ncbi:MAG TPA: DNA repair protein RecN [Flavobacteriaceae bacterium]|nr:DNA repair protein RecN [Flavobacteriaceae bacterium]